jgi:hypothetical protein
MAGIHEEFVQFLYESAGKTLPSMLVVGMALLGMTGSGFSVLIGWGLQLPHKSGLLPLNTVILPGPLILIPLWLVELSIPAMDAEQLLS